MKKLQAILLAAALIAGCKTLEKQTSEEEAYKRGVRDGIQKVGEVVWEAFQEKSRSHLLTDQIYLTNISSLCSTLAGKCEQEGDEEGAEFYKKRASETRFELARIEGYFKNFPDPNER